MLDNDGETHCKQPDHHLDVWHGGATPGAGEGMAKMAQLPLVLIQEPCLKDGVLRSSLAMAATNGSLTESR